MVVRLSLQIFLVATIFSLSAADRFPHLSRLPKKSLVRQKCLASRNNWLFKDPIQIACEELEKDCKYMVENEGRGRPRSLDKLTYDENVDIIMVPDENPRSYTTTEEAMRFRGINPKDERAFEKYAQTVCREQVESAAVLNLYSIIKYEAKAKSCNDTKSMEVYARLIAECKRNMETICAADDTAEKTLVA